MKKMFLVALSLCMILSTAACGQKPASSSQATAPEPAVVPSDSAAPAAPQKWKPSKPITILNPYAAGGAGDLEVKALQPILQKELGVSIVTDYLTTGGGAAALEKIFESDPDGYSIAYLNNPAASIAELTDEVTYKTLAFTYIQNVSTEYRCLAALPSCGVKDIADLVKQAKEGRTFTIAHSGIGSSGHLQTLLIEKALGIDLNDVPFAGTSAAKAAVLGGHVDLWAIDAVSIAPLVASGEVMVIGMCAPERHRLLPDVQTFKEAGYEGVEVSTSRGFIAPPNLPEDVKSALIKAFNASVNSQEMKDYANTVGTTLNPISGDEYLKFTEATYNSIAEIKDLFAQ